MVAVRVFTFVEAGLVLPVKVTVLPPEVLPVPRYTVLGQREARLVRAEIHGGRRLALLVAHRRVALAQRLRVGQVRALMEHPQVDAVELLLVLPEPQVHTAVLQRLDHALRQLVLSVRQLRVLALVLPLVREQLAGTVQDVVALRPDAVYVIAHLRKSAVLVRADLALHELLKAVPGQLLVFDMVRLVLLHVRFVLKRKPTARSSAVEMRRPLSKERTVRSAALLCRAVPLKTFLYNCRILPMVIGVHLYVGRRNVYLVTALFDTVVVRLFFVVRAVRVTVRAVVQRTIPHKAVLQGLVSLLVPFKMAYHFLLLDENSRVTVETVKMFPIVQVLAVGVSALQRGGEFFDVLRVVDLGLRLG
uniref:Uncharacterized protein n=1 Tax=Photinus pyralis TaxID=7054 RepID=A0A1Y1NCC4_PHOPY